MKINFRKISIAILTIVLLTTMILPVHAFAYESIWQGYTATTVENFGVPFNTGNGNTLTISAKADLTFGVSGTVTIKIQKYVSGAWITVKTEYCPTNGIVKNIAKEIAVDKNTYYRITCFFPDGSASLSLGIVV